MAQFVDKAALVAEIERRMKSIRMAFSMQGILHGHDRAYTNAQYDAFNSLLSFLDTLEVKEIYKQSPTKDLKTAAGNYAFTQSEEDEVLKYYSFIAGAEWQEEQFEKNRIEQCDKITEEQYNLETGFIDQHIEKHHCMPTFLDAIEYGMKKQREITYESM